MIYSCACSETIYVFSVNIQDLPKLSCFLMIGAVRKHSDFLFASTNEDSRIEILKSRTVNDSKGAKVRGGCTLGTYAQTLRFWLVLCRFCLDSLEWASWCSCFLLLSPVVPRRTCLRRRPRSKKFVSKDLCGRDGELSLLVIFVRLTMGPDF